jgi:hypothetical protein
VYRVDVSDFPPIDPSLTGDEAIPKSPYTHDERETLADVPE